MGFMEKLDDRMVRRFGVGWLLGRQCHSIVERVQWATSFIGGEKSEVLDAGSGGGPVAFVLASRGHVATAIELEPRASNIRRRYGMIRDLLPGSVSVVAQDLRALDTWDDSSRYDHIILLEVIEHIMDDQKLVGDLAARLAPGGQLYITTPNERYHGLIGDYVHETEDADHVRWGYSEERLREICGMAGLDAEHVTYLCGFIGQQLINLRIALHRLLRINPNITLVATYPLRALRVLDRFIPFQPLSIAVVARKRA